MEIDSYFIIIACSVMVILSFFFGEISRKTSVPSVLMLIAFGIGLKLVMEKMAFPEYDFLPVLGVLGIVGLIMIVLEAALELKLEREKLGMILKAMGIALVGLVGSAYVAAVILHQMVPGMTMGIAWLYATPLSILSSAIIIPSVSSLNKDKREFHIYESTFSDIFGIMMFYFLESQLDHSGETGGGVVGFLGGVGGTVAISVIAGYGLILIFQQLRSQAKLFLLISVLLLLYAVGKRMHLSSLIIILIFGMIIANMDLFFRGKLKRFLKPGKAQEIYEGLHMVTMETAFVVRTFFFVIFGLTITIASLYSIEVATVSGLIVLSIYAIRFVVLRLVMGKDIFPQVFIAPRGLITILLFSAIPADLEVPGFEKGILLFLIISTSVIMTIAMVIERRRSGAAIKSANQKQIGSAPWKAKVEE